MSVLYALRYSGSTGMGVAAICVGGGRIVGFDGADGRYLGNYTTANGRLRGSLTLTMAGTWPLVTGDTAHEGQALSLEIDVPVDFGNGQPQVVSLNGKPVSITAEKIGEIP